MSCKIAAICSGLNALTHHQNNCASIGIHINHGYSISTSPGLKKGKIGCGFQLAIRNPLQT